MRAQVVDPRAAMIAWPVLGPLLQRALVHSLGEYEIDDVRDAIERGEMTLFVATNGYEVIGAMVAQVLPFPRKRILHVLLTAGKRMREWQPLMDRLVTAWARENGCTVATAYCRPGMARVLHRDPDYKTAYTIVSRDLEGAR